MCGFFRSHGDKQWVAFLFFQMSFYFAAEEGAVREEHTDVWLLFPSRVTFLFCSVCWLLGHRSSRHLFLSSGRRKLQQNRRFQNVRIESLYPFLSRSFASTFYGHVNFSILLQA